MHNEKVSKKASLVVEKLWRKALKNRSVFLPLCTKLNYRVLSF